VLLVLPQFAVGALGFLVAAFGFAYMSWGLVRFRRSKYMAPTPMKPQWIAIFLSRRIPRENVTERDIEEEGSANSIVAGGLAVVVGVAMVRYAAKPF
jgi:hypothetical protein